MWLKHVEKKKYKDVITRLRNGCLITFKKIQKQPPEVFCKKAVLKNFAIFIGRTGKHLYWSLFLIKNIAKLLRTPILKNGCFCKCVHETENY